MSPDRIQRARPQRGKSLITKPPARRPRRVIYLVAEGEVTEYDYGTALSNSFSAALGFRIEKPSPHIRRNGLTPIKVAHHALEVANDKGSAIREIWALFDRDQHTRIPEAMALLAGHESIHVAFSHPSFDLWLLLHFATVSSPQGGSSQQVHSKLSKCPSFAGFGSHDKRITEARATELMNRIATAVRNAKTLVKNCPSGCCSVSGGHAVQCDPLKRDPSTDVWRLVECLGIPDVLI